MLTLPIALVWIVPLAAAAVYGVYKRANGQYSQPATRKAHKQVAAKTGEALTEPANLVRGSAGQIVADGLRSMRRLIARAAAAVEALPQHKARVERLRQVLASRTAQVSELLEATRGVVEPYFGYAQAARYKSILLVGDLALVAVTFMAIDANMSLLIAAAAAIAIAVALFTQGTALGDLLRQQYTKPAAWALALGALTLLVVGLFAIRIGSTLGWVAMNSAPGLAAAAVVLLGPNRNQASLHRSRKAEGKAGKAHEKALDKLGSARARVQSLRSQVRIALVSNGAFALSQGQMAGIDNVLVAYAEVARQLGISLDNGQLLPFDDLGTVATTFDDDKAIPTNLIVLPVRPSEEDDNSLGDPPAEDLPDETEEPAV